jgi:glycosyltransferase involved in cell wall biosynthesis
VLSYVFGAQGSLMTAKRLLLLAPTLTGYGGTERVVLGLSELLAAPDHKVFLASFDESPVRTAFETTAPIYSLGQMPQLPLPLRPISYAVAARRLKRLKRRLGIDVTISNLWRADLINVLSGGKDRKVAICHQTVVSDPINRLMVSLRPFVAEIYRRFDRVIAVSQPLASELKALYRLSAPKITAIENFFDRPQVSSRLPLDGLQRFIFVGRLAAVKNVEGLLQVWRVFCKDRSRVQLVVIGDGPVREGLLRLAAQLGLSVGRTVNEVNAQVVFMGHQSKPAEYMFGARALLLSSQAEGFGMVVLEALSLGLPVLASDCACGAVRSVLLGHGDFNPNREHAEYGSAGVLLPVPDGARPSTLSVWREALLKASQDEAEWAAWQEGALVRASHFTSDVARVRWSKAICF